MTHVCVSKLTITGSDNGFSLGRLLAIIWTNAGNFLMGPLGTNFTKIFIAICTYSFKKMHLEMSLGKWRPFCFGPNVVCIETNHVWLSMIWVSSMMVVHRVLEAKMSLFIDGYLSHNAAKCYIFFDGVPKQNPWYVKQRRVLMIRNDTYYYRCRWNFLMCHVLENFIHIAWIWFRIYVFNIYNLICWFEPLTMMRPWLLQCI